MRAALICLTTTITAFAAPTLQVSTPCDTDALCAAGSKCIIGLCAVTPVGKLGDLCNQFSINPTICDQGLKCVKQADPTKWYRCEFEMTTHQQHDVRTTDAEVALDSLLHLETMLEQSGYDDGFRDGLELGLTEGRDLGSRIAVKTAREVGYYLGVAEELLGALNADESGRVKVLVHDRAVRVLESVVSLSRTFPKTNDHSLDIVPLLEKIRGKFRLATVLLKMPQLKFDLETNAPSISMEANVGVEEVVDLEVSLDSATTVTAQTTSKKPDLSF
ncbi:UNVERIFIED_CONTAM: hypothetical protein HDU68_008241 [Siphonaria sp. JEL0065]|nr:hypothetical protein HDU68_008241 [Siphonaria sp. JEL0065]